MRPIGRSGLAWINLVIATAIVALLVAFLIPAIQRVRDRAYVTLCADHLRAIGVMLGNYETFSGGSLPLSITVDGPHADLLSCVAASHCVVDPKLFYCPAQQRPELSYSPENIKAGRIGYYWYAANGVTSNSALSKFLRSGLIWPRHLDTTMDHRSWVMSDIWISGLPTAHSGYRKGMNYLMLDGSVAFITESPRQSFR